MSERETKRGRENTRREEEEDVPRHGGKNMPAKKNETATNGIVVVVSSSAAAAVAARFSRHELLARCGDTIYYRYANVETARINVARRMRVYVCAFVCVQYVCVYVCMRAVA